MIVASVTRCRGCNLLIRVDHGEPPGPLHKSAYIPTEPWHAMRALVARPLERCELFEHWLLGLL